MARRREGDFHSWRRGFCANGRDQRMVAFGAALKHSFLLEGPPLADRRSERPSGVLLKHEAGVVEIGSEVGAEIETSPLPCPLGGGGE